MSQSETELRNKRTRDIPHEALLNPFKQSRSTRLSRRQNSSSQNSRDESENSDVSMS